MQNRQILGPHGARVAAATTAVVLSLIVLGSAFGSAVAASAPLPPANSCIAPILPCYIVLSITSGSRGNTETVSGYRFWPGEPFTVYFWNGSAGASAPAVGTGSTGTGDFSASFRVPGDPVGNYTVFVTDLAGDNQSAAFHLTRLTASPDSGPVGNTTQLSGQGFLPDHVVRFHVDGVRASTSASCRTNVHGAFSKCALTVPSVPTGSTRLTATDGTYTARIEFVVT
jgi:hypothetical protein